MNDALGKKASIARDLLKAILRSFEQMGIHNVAQGASLWSMH
jgi:hypothetical protein